MKEQEEKRSKWLERYKNVNKITFVGALGVALFVPALVVPALAWAAVDGVQIFAIDKINKKKQSPKEQVVYQAGAA